MQMDAVMSKTEAATVVYFGPVKPALTDIPGACAYLGNLSRAKLYADILSDLDVVRFGGRTFVTVESLDRLIAAKRKVASEPSPDVLTPQRQRRQRAAHRTSEPEPQP
jgi:hypothetical protein